MLSGVGKGSATIPGSNKNTGYIRFTYKPTSSSIRNLQLSPPTMATLAADGVPPQPPHPTMPPYASRETDLHSNELSFQVERPRKPKIWEITNPSTQSHAEPTHHPTTTMETTKTPASHATALPPLSSLPTASVSTHWQDNRLKIANILDRTDVNTQHQTKRGLRKPPDNQRQPLTTLPQDSLTNPNDIGQHDDSQCPISGDKPVQRNNILQQITTTPNLAHAANTTPSYTKIPEKVTLHLPQHQSTHYNNIVINQTATETIAITTTAFHQNAHSRTTNDSARPTLTNTSFTAHPNHYCLSCSCINHIHTC